MCNTVAPCAGLGYKIALKIVSVFTSLATGAISLADVNYVAVVSPSYNSAPYFKEMAPKKICYRQRLNWLNYKAHLALHQQRRLYCCDEQYFHEY